MRIGVMRIFGCICAVTLLDLCVHLIRCSDCKWRLHDLRLKLGVRFVVLPTLCNCRFQETDVCLVIQINWHDLLILCCIISLCECVCLFLCNTVFCTSASELCQTAEQWVGREGGFLSDAIFNLLHCQSHWKTAAGLLINPLRHCCYLQEGRDCVRPPHSPPYRHFPVRSCRSGPLFLIDLGSQ